MLKNDWKFLLCITIILITITSLPYLYGYLVRPADTVFLGIGVFNPVDPPVYYSYIEQAKSGHWLFKDLFTSEPGQKPFLNLLWLAIGGLAKILSLSPILAFHLSRLILIPLFVFVVYKFCRLVFAEAQKERLKIKLTSVLFFFSGGFGGLVSFFSKNTIPLESWWPEAYAFWSIYHSPHFVASWILIVASFYFLLKGYLNGRWKEIVWAGLLAALASQFHSFYLALFVPISLAFAFYELFSKKIAGKKIFFQTIVYNLFLVPIAFYYLWYLLNDQVMFGRLFENIMLTPYLALVITAFGFNSILGGIAIFQYLKSKKGGSQSAPTLIWDFIVIWAVSVLFLLYSPLPFQRRLIEGWQLPVVILAVPLLLLFLDIWRTSQGRLTRYLFYLLIPLLFFSSNLVVWLNSFAIYHQPSRQPNFYLSENLWQALSWLEKQGGWEEVVLTAHYTGLITPFLAEKKVFLGHNYETIKSQVKSKIVQWFFGGNGEDEKKKEFLKQTNVKYVIWGEREKQLGDFQPEEKDYLKKIFENRETRIYQITL